MKELIVRVKAPLIKYSLYPIEDKRVSINIVGGGEKRGYYDFAIIYSSDFATTAPHVGEKLLKEYENKLKRRNSVLSTRYRTHKHSYISSYTAKDIEWRCACGSMKTAPTPKSLAKTMTFKALCQPSRKRNVHYVYHKFVERFCEKVDAPPNAYKQSGYELREAVEKWAKRYPNDIKIVSCDDSYHCNASLVLIEHKAKEAYMGTTVVYIPQCSGETPIEFFLYPGHNERLTKALQHIRKVAAPIEKLERELSKQRQQEVNELLNSLEPED